MQFDTLPESYRSVILKHHEEVRTELVPIFKAFEEPLRELDKPVQNIGIIATVDPADERPEALALTLPIPFSVYTDLNDLAESLQHIVAYRCCAAVSGMLLRAGVPSAPVQFVDYHGMISIRVWLGDHDITGDLKKALELELERLAKKSTELKAVQIGLEVAWVNLDVLMDDGE